MGLDAYGYLIVGVPTGEGLSSPVGIPTESNPGSLAQFPAGNSSQRTSLAA